MEQAIRRVVAEELRSESRGFGRDATRAVDEGMEAAFTMAAERLQRRADELDGAGVTEPKVHDEIEIERVAERLYNDAWSRSKNSWCVPWAEASPELHTEYCSKAGRLLDGVLLIPAEGVMHKPLSDIEIEEIPHVISVLMARWTQVVGSIPSLPSETSGSQQSAETVDYVGPLQDLDIVLTPSEQNGGEWFVDIETPNGYSVEVGTRTTDPASGDSKIRIRVPFADLPEESQRCVQRHG